MKTTTTNSQQTVIIYLDINTIIPSDFNPRKTFKEIELKELAESIKVQGVLQPIMVRPLENGLYEIVYGERRYRASLLASQITIPVIIKELADNEAIEYAITENLQRSDVAPIEEAIAYKQLMNSNYTIEVIVEKFGKSISYVRNRLQLNELIPQFIELVESDVINISIAIELAKCSKETQEELFKEHYNGTIENWNNWSKLTHKEIVLRLKQNYCNKLSNYGFDKNDCVKCSFNSAKSMLFVEETDEICTNAGCLKNKLNTYMFEQVNIIKQAKPKILIGSPEYNQNVQVIADLQANGEEIRFGWFSNYSTEPVKPTKEKTEKKEVFNERMEEYNKEVEEYLCEQQQLIEDIANEKIQQYVIINKDSVTEGYLKVENNSNAVPLTPLEKLKKRDEQYKDLMHRKITDDICKIVRELEVSDKVFVDLEEKMMYFIMLKSLNKKELEAIGYNGEYYLSNSKKMELIENLTDKTKDIIKRAFLINNFSNASGTSEEAILITAFAEYHNPKDTEDIKKQYQKEYEKRHTNISKKIAEL